MSLVAYAASSDEESDNEEASEQPQPCIPSTSSKNLNKTRTPIPVNGQISDDDEDFAPTTNSPHDEANHRPLTLLLPKPKNQVPTQSDLSESLHDLITPIFAKLPMPKASQKANNVIEEDDEFLHKKATPVLDAEKKKPLPISTSVARATVKITIPSMKEFADVDKDIAQSGQQLGAQTQIKVAKKSGLLAVLPQAKSEQNFAKSENKTTVDNAPTISSTSNVKSANMLVPDTVRNRRPAKNTEGVDGIKALTNSRAKSIQKPASTKASLVDCSDSEASDDDGDAGDFFSLNDDEKLPEVNPNELNVMVAKRAAKMAVATTKYLESTDSGIATGEDCMQPDEKELRRAQKRYHDSQLNEEALHALVGSKSKRRRQQQSQIEIVDISGNQVLPDRDEWMRTALASSTSYQPTGVLVDEEPASGTRRKHQITYLAHKAKANEAELQAMWSANRQNRRATQSKYGF